MRYFFSFVFVFYLFSCTKYVDEPKKKLSREEMAMLIAEIAINEETLQVNPQGLPQEGVYFLLKKYGITDEDFKENYTYYLTKKEMDGILEKAGEKVMKMHPKAKEYIEKTGKSPMENNVLMNP